MSRLLACLLLAIAVAACGGAPHAGGTNPPAERADAVAAQAGAAKQDPTPKSSPDLAGSPAGAVDYSCTVDADCAVKNVGNCCGYYPACVNRASPTFPEQVQARCQAEGIMSICGYPELQGCTCEAGRCEGVGGPGGGTGEVQ